MKSASEFSMR